MNKPLPDGFQKLADELSRRAAAESDAAARQSLLDNAETFRRIDREARAMLDSAERVRADFRDFERRRSAAETVLFGVTIAIIWLLAALRGLGMAPAGVAGAFSMLLGAVWLMQRRKLQTPRAAWAWLGLRTIIGVIGALLFFGIPVGVFTVGGVDSLHGARLASLVLSCLLGVLCMWIGFVGWSRNPLRDLQLRKERKSRYGWPF